jgi:hypothetical protein
MNPVTGVSLGGAMIATGVAAVVLVALFIVGKLKKKKK